eukprot:TRINITY_DN50131_c0_g1_i1.p1 TRINITY_DN50131_c0_g1~~TRINITY_DN50131_c0_g1_i1.p1  ORF type:complete len:346 (+),score=97.96 TRINITY_DN50131_c0_g1_i1:30-1040(+)
MAGLPPMTQTEEKLRGMGVTMDQRKRLMMASKFGLGPLGQLGLGSKGDDRVTARSRSPPPVSKLALLPPQSVGGGSSSSTAKVVPTAGGYMVPAQEAERQRKRAQEQAARAQAISRGGTAVKAMATAVVSARDDEEDLNSFLAGGRKMAQAAEKAKKERKLVMESASKDNFQQAADAAKKDKQERLDQERLQAEKQRRQEEEKQRLEAEKLRLEEDRKQEERRRRKEEEKMKKRAEKAKRKAEAEPEAGETSSSEESEARQKSSVGSVFKQIMKGDETKRMHWGESVKGRVSGDYKGMSDAELERRFGATQAKSSGEKLMTEAEVLAMLRRSKNKK